MLANHYQLNEIDEQIQRARAALSAKVDIAEVINNFVMSGITRDDAFLSVMAAELSIKYQDILESKHDKSSY